MGDTLGERWEGACDRGLVRSPARDLPQVRIQTAEQRAENFGVTMWFPSAPLVFCNEQIVLLCKRKRPVVYPDLINNAIIAVVRDLRITGRVPRSNRDFLLAIRCRGAQIAHMLKDLRVDRLPVDIELDSIRLRQAPIEHEHEMEPLIGWHRTRNSDVVLRSWIGHNSGVNNPIDVSHTPLVWTICAARTLSYDESTAVGKSPHGSRFSPSSNTELRNGVAEYIVENITASDIAGAAVETESGVFLSEAIEGGRSIDNSAIAVLAAFVLAVAVQTIVCNQTIRHKYSIIARRIRARAQKGQAK